MNIPAIEEVENLWDKYHVPENVRSHCRKVAEVAVKVGNKLKKSGENINLNLLEKAALLHDLARTVNFKHPEKHPGASCEDISFWQDLIKKYGNRGHEEVAEDFLKDKYPELAKIVGSHAAMHKIMCNDIKSWEIKILIYADSRVLHDKIVSLNERYADTKERHGWFFEKIKKETGRSLENMHEELKKLEKQIFDKIDIEPEDIK